MGKQFFTISPSAEGEQTVQINQLRLPRSDLIKLLQVTLIKKGAKDIATTYASVLDKAHNSLTSNVSKGIEDIIAPLYDKFFAFFSVVLSMEDGNPVQHVNWMHLDASLITLEEEVQHLFQKYAGIIWAFKTLVFIPFFQNFLQNELTKSRVAECFAEKSVRPILFQMLVNEYDENGITSPPITREPERVDTTAEEDQALAVVLERIEHYENTKVLPTDVAEHIFFRDLAYLKILITEEFQYCSEDGQFEVKCRLSALNQSELSQLADRLLQSPADAKQTQRRLLQVLAILCALYQDATQTALSDRALASILLAVSQSKIALQWQLDVNQPSPGALLVYISLQCLQGDVVHIEQAARLLALDELNEPHRLFLASLGILYTPYLSHTQTKMGLLHLRKLKQQPQTYYFGSQIIQLGTHPAFNDYLAHGLLECKQKVLQVFEAWAALLGSDETQPNLLQSYRSILIENTERAWIDFVVKHAPYHHLLHIDQMKAAFQNQELGCIWSVTEQALLDYVAQQKSALIGAEQIRFLTKESSRLLTKSTPADHTNALSAVRIARDRMKQQALLARLHYEQSYWLGTHKMQWLQIYLKQHMSHLQRLCPEVPKASTAIEQLNLGIRYLAGLPKTAISLECIAAATLSVQLFHCVDAILPWAKDSEIQAHIAGLSLMSSKIAITSLAKQMQDHFHWVTETDSFYYQWLESNVVKQATAALYQSARRLSSEPNEQHIKTFLLVLTEQQALLAQRSYYVPWGWFLGYPDTQAVLETTLQQVQSMVSLQQIPAHYLKEAEQSARCQSVMQQAQAAIKQMNIPPVQHEQFHQVLQQIQKIEASYTGYAKLYELRAYLETQRHTFMQTQYSCFYGPKHRDQMNAVITILNQGLIHLGQSAKTILTDPAYLAKKAVQIQEKLPDATHVRIHPTACDDPFVDVWITSSQPIPNFEPDTCIPNTWHKRFYHADDLCAYTRELRVFASPISQQHSQPTGSSISLR